MDMDTRSAMYRLSTYICVHMAEVNCEKYGKKGNFGQKLVIYPCITINFSVLYICDNTNAHIYTCSNVYGP